jgi:hypothetical protein
MTYLLNEGVLKSSSLLDRKGQKAARQRKTPWIKNKEHLL